MVDLLLLKAQDFRTVLICLSVRTAVMNKIKDGQNNCLTRVPELQILFNGNMETGWLRAGERSTGKEMGKGSGCCVEGELMIAEIFISTAVQ